KHARIPRPTALSAATCTQASPPALRAPTVRVAVLRVDKQRRTAGPAAGTTSGRRTTKATASSHGPTPTTYLATRRRPALPSSRAERTSAEHTSVGRLWAGRMPGVRRWAWAYVSTASPGGSLSHAGVSQVRFSVWGVDRGNALMRDAHGSVPREGMAGVCSG